MTPALFGAEATARVEGGVQCGGDGRFVRHRRVMLVGSTVNNTDSRIAVPRVPPIWRKKAAALVETPIVLCRSRGLCGQSQGLHQLAQAGADDEHRDHHVPRGRSGLTWVMITKPIAVVAVPVIGKIRLLAGAPRSTDRCRWRRS